MSERQFKLREMRNRAKLNQQQVADALGIPKGRYGDWERETTTLNLKDAIELADLFNCSLDELAGHEVHDREQQQISAEEMILVEGYRIANDSQQLIMLATADAVIKQSEESAREKKEVI
jgi:DNA-binding XRE family transcriptional regulator